MTGRGRMTIHAKKTAVHSKNCRFSFLCDMVEANMRPAFPGSPGGGERRTGDMILIAIVDDDRQDGQALKECIERYFEGRNTAYLIQRFFSGVEFIRSRTAYDIVFMDIRIADMNGLDAAYFLRIINKDAKLIFVTHMVQMAIRGYEVGAMDFIAKPVARTAVERAMERALDSLKKYEGGCFALETMDGLVSLPVCGLYYVEVSDHNLVYHTQQGDYRVRGRFGEVREKLNDRFLVPCGRSHLVNMRHVQSVHSDHLMVNGVRIQVAKSRHKKIEQAFLSCVGERA